MKILDVCCGGKQFYFDKKSPYVTFMDIRKQSMTLCDGRKFKVEPDVIGDFRKIPFADDSYDMVVFDPPHLIHAGETSWLVKKYGVLNAATWKEDLKDGFTECFRVLKPEGTLIFKWCEEQIPLSDVLKQTKHPPLLGNRRAKTHWIVFIKEKINEKSH